MIQKGKLTKVQEEILDLIPKNEWFYEYTLDRNQLLAQRNVCSQLNKIYKKGFLERRVSTTLDKMPPWFFDYKVKQ